MKNNENDSIGISEVSIEGIRIFDKKETFSFKPGLNFITGPNASGKTTLLKAIYFCCNELVPENNYGCIRVPQEWLNDGVKGSIDVSWADGSKSKIAISIAEQANGKRRMVVESETDAKNIVGQLSGSELMCCNIVSPQDEHWHSIRIFEMDLKGYVAKHPGCPLLLIRFPWDADTDRAYELLARFSSKPGVQLIVETPASFDPHALIEKIEKSERFKSGKESLPNIVSLKSKRMQRGPNECREEECMPRFG